MPIKSYKVGPGVLTLGAVGTSLDITAQITKAVVSWSKNKEDNTPVLSGEELQGERTYTASLKATIIQDLETAGLVRYSWAHKGESVPFSYTPSTEVGASITGVLELDPLDVGGDAKTRPTSEVEWECVGEPQIGADLT